MIIGNLTRDPEVKSLPSGVNVASFGVATNSVYRDKAGEKKETVEFHNIVTFGKQAEIIGQYLHKGSQEYVEGRLQTRSWEKDGQKHYRTETVAERIQFGNRPKGDETAQHPTPTRNAEPQSAQEGTSYPDDEINPDDIPF